LNIEAGSLVLSVAGRDKGKLFVVLGLENEFCYLSDGKLRKLERPKKKKLKHVQPTGKAIEALRNKIVLGERLTNAEIRKSISGFVLNDQVS